MTFYQTALSLGFQSTSDKTCNWQEKRIRRSYNFRKCINNTIGQLALQGEVKGRDKAGTGQGQGRDKAGTRQGQGRDKAGTNSEYSELTEMKRRDYRGEEKDFLTLYNSCIL